MKTKLYIEQISIISSLGFGIEETFLNLKNTPKIQSYLLDDKHSLPISKTNLNFQSNQEKAYSQAELVISDILMKLPISLIKSHKTALLVGCTKGESQVISNNLIQKKLNYQSNAESSANLINKNLSTKFQIPFLPVSSAACATGAQAIQKVNLLLNERKYKKIILCMTEASLTKEMVSAFYQLGVLTNEPFGTAPFHKNQKGFHMGEGAASFLFSKSKTKNSIGKILGAASATDAFHFTSFPNGPQKIWETIISLCQTCNIRLCEIDHVNLHGTGTSANDKMELSLAKNLIKENENISFSAYKPFTGHLLGASGLTELALSFICTQNNWFPPILNCNPKENLLPSNFILDPKGKQKEIKYFINLSYGLGSTIGVVLGEKL